MPDVWKQVAGELNTLLAPHGFRRSGLRFVNTRNPEVVRTITVSKFRWNTPGDYRFHLIVSIYLATGNTGEFAFAGCAGRYSIVFERSAGYLLGDEALLYRVPEPLSSEAFREPPRTDLEQRVLPFLEPATASTPRSVFWTPRAAGPDRACSPCNSPLRSPDCAG